MKLTRLTIATMAFALVPAGVVGVATSGSAAPSAQAGKYHVSLKISAKEATAREDTVKLKGAVTPVPPKGSTVVVQAQYENGNTWKKVGTAKVDKDGQYKFLEKPKSHLDRVYRVVKAKDDRGAKGISRERALHVVMWSWLSGLVPSAGANTFVASSMPINGEDYVHTLYADRTKPSAFVEYTLGRDCLTLETTFGLSDRTETGGKGSIRLTNDGTVAYERVFDLGFSDSLSLDMTNVYRMRIDFGQVPTTPATEPSAGAARVLCD
jgi:hypothetical protein